MIPDPDQFDPCANCGHAASAHVATSVVGSFDANPLVLQRTFGPCTSQPCTCQGYAWSVTIPTGGSSD